MTLTAEWVDNDMEYYVIFKTGGGTDVPYQTLTYGQKATEPTPPTKEGVTFDHWEVRGGDGSVFKFDTPITDDIVLDAVWSDGSGRVRTASKKAVEPQDTMERLVFFDSDGGSAVPYQMVQGGSAATKPNPSTKAGYAFGGWTISSDGAESFYDFKAPVTSDMRLRARWYSFDGAVYGCGDGSGRLPTPTMPGYTFTGWKERKYSCGDNIDSLAAGAVVYEAEWEKDDTEQCSQ
jgi:hypothetical protein